MHRGGEESIDHIFLNYLAAMTLWCKLFNLLGSDQKCGEDIDYVI